MTKVLYLTNIETPYRVHFFNELAKVCDLTVMYERRKSANRNAKWASSVQKTFNVEFLDGKEIGNEYSFSFGITKTNNFFISFIKSNKISFSISE